jgi:hypothetical protein
MNLKDKKAALRAGLGQIPKSGLRRLKRWLEDGKPILLDGMIFDESTGHM